MTRCTHGVRTVRATPSLWLAMNDSDTNTKRCKTGADVASTQSANRLNACSFKLFCGGEVDKKYVMLHPQLRLVAHLEKARTPCAPRPQCLWYHLCALSPSLMVPPAHLVPIAHGTPCPPCPHCLGHALRTMSPLLMAPPAYLVPIAHGTPCPPYPHRLGHTLRTMSPLLMVPLVHLVPIA